MGRIFLRKNTRNEHKKEKAAEVAPSTHPSPQKEVYGQHTRG